MLYDEFDEYLEERWRVTGFSFHRFNSLNNPLDLRKCFFHLVFNIMVCKRRRRRLVGLER